ncbi:flagellar protein FlgN [bacterium]|nr:flagellar protein FlgN [bacterium]
MRPNSTDCDSLFEIFKDILDRIQILHEILLQEKQILSQRSVEALESVATKKHDVATGISQLLEKQENILKEMNNSRDTKDLWNYLKLSSTHHPDLMKLKPLWLKISQLLDHCKALNDVNGACIELLSRHNTRSLQILRGQFDIPYTYGPDGARCQQNMSRTVTSV